MHIISQSVLSTIHGGNAILYAGLTGYAVAALLYNTYSMDYRYPVQHFYVDGPLTLETLEKYNIVCDTKNYAYCEVWLNT